MRKQYLNPKEVFQSPFFTHTVAVSGPARIIHVSGQVSYDRDGFVIGEGSGSFPEGLGRAIINFNEQYITFPGKLWAAIFFSALVGIAFFLLVRAAEYLVLRDRRSALAS